MRKVLSLLLCLTLCLSLVPTVSAEDEGEIIEESQAIEEAFPPKEEETILEETEEKPETLLDKVDGEALEAGSGTCGENLTWTLDDAGNLTVSGTGEMYNYTITSAVEAPWGHDIVTLTLEDGATSIGAYAFSGCASLTEVNLPASLSSIGNCAFRDCSNLKTITIPENVSQIGAAVFRGCTSLETIAVDEENAFYSSYEGMLLNKNATTLLCCPGGKSGNCFIPYSVNDIDLYAFFDSNQLTSIAVDPNNRTYCSADGVLYSFDKSLLLRYPGGRQGAFSVPDTVNRIQNRAFFRCDTLTSVTLPEGLAGIDECAFYGCEGLTEIAFPNSLESVGWDAFRGCSNLEALTMPSVSTRIGEGAFYACQSLKDVFYGGTETQWHTHYIEVLNDPLFSATIHFTPEPEPSAAYSYALSLTDSIDINFTVKNLGAGTKPEDYFVLYTFGGKTGAATLTSMTSNTVVIANIAAKEMTEDVTVEVWYKDRLLKTGTYSVRGYCEAMLNARPGAKLTALLQSCLDYGSYAQKYFNYRTDDLANRGSDYGNVPGIVIPEAANVKEGSCTGIVSPSYSLMLQSKTSFQISFNHSSGAKLGDYTFTVNGTAVTPTDTGSKFVIDLNGIAAKNLGDRFVVTVTHRDGTSYRFESAPVNYMYAARNTAVGNTMKALYAYHQAAVNYFA